MKKSFILLIFSFIMLFSISIYASEISNFEHSTKIIDSSRTIASNISCFVTVETIAGMTTKEPVSAYVEWYVSGSGNIY